MNVIKKINFISALFTLAACNTESQLEIDSFKMTPECQTEVISGYVITDKNDLLSVPSEFKKIHSLSLHLLEEHWLENPNFIGDVTELKRLFRETKLPEAASYIATLETTKQRYLNNLENVNTIANAMQREIDKDLSCYQHTIEKLKYSIELLETPKETYQEKIQVLEEEIKQQSKHYSQLRLALQRNLQQVLDRHVPGTQLIHDLKFNYENQPHAICRQFKGMSELVATIPQNCVYINRAQLLADFPSHLKDDAEHLIDSHVPKIWQAMILLHGYFDTMTNTEYFETSLKYQIAQARQALREKRFIDQKGSEQTLNQLKMKLALAKKQHSQIINNASLDEHHRVDTSSQAFIQLMTKAQSPVKPFSDIYNTPDINQSFTDAYAKKMLKDYPAELYFTVSPNGLFSIPKQTNAEQLVFNFTDNNQFLTYNITKQSTLPHVIRSESQHAELITHSLVKELNRQLQEYWHSQSNASY